MDQDEGLDEAAKRELEEETGVTNRTLVQTGAYGGLELTAVVEVGHSFVHLSYLSLDFLSVPVALPGRCGANTGAVSGAYSPSPTPGFSRNESDYSRRPLRRLGVA